MRTRHQHDLARLATPLARVHKMRDPHARRMVLSQSGFAGLSDGESHRAAEIAMATRATAPIAVTKPLTDDLVERMGEALVSAVHGFALALQDRAAVAAALVFAGFGRLEAGRPEIVASAVARARAKLRRTVLLDCAADTAALGAMLMSWVGGYCLLCPPAHAAARDAVLTDERLFGLVTWAPIALAVLCVLLFVFREHGKPLIADEAPEPVLAPPAARGIEDLQRFADRG